MEEQKRPIEKTEQSKILCKKCGAKLSFAPGTKSLVCEYCQTTNEIEIEEREIEEIDFVDFINQQTDTAPKQEVVTICCDACGAETTFDENLVSQSCVFCGNNLIVKNGTTNTIIQPKSLLPFSIDEKQANEKFHEWLRKLWFAPNDLKKYARKGKLTGVYIPYWTYDSNTYTSYSGERGDDYQEEEEYEEDGETKTRTVTKTRWYSVSGSVSNAFDDVLVVASHSLPDKLVDKLEPWDVDNLIPYNDKFLSGFKAETYQVDVKDGFETAKGKMEKVIREDVRRDIGGDHQRIHSLDTNYSDITFKHILLPIWLSAYRYNDKSYRFIINARNGKVKGERPWSWIKISLLILVIAAIITAIVLLTRS